MKQIGKIRKLSKWVLHELMKKKICYFEVSSYSVQQQTILNHILICFEMWILYNEQLSSCSEKKIQSTFQSQTFIKKVHDHCLADCHPSDLLQLFE